MHKTLWTFMPTFSPNVNGGERADGSTWAWVAVGGRLIAPTDPDKDGKDPIKTGPDGLDCRLFEWCDDISEAEKRAKDPLFNSQIVINSCEISKNKYNKDGESKQGDPNLKIISYDPKLMTKVQLGGGTRTNSVLQESAANYA